MDGLPFNNENKLVLQVHHIFWKEVLYEVQLH